MVVAHFRVKFDILATPAYRSPLMVLFNIAELLLDSDCQLVQSQQVGEVGRDYSETQYVTQQR